MLHPCMIHLILCQIDSTHAITVDLQEIMINPQVVKQPLKPIASFIASIMAIYSASAVDKMTIDYRTEYQLISTWDNVNTYPIVV